MRSKSLRFKLLLMTSLMMAGLVGGSALSSLYSFLQGQSHISEAAQNAYMTEAEGKLSAISQITSQKIAAMFNAAFEDAAQMAAVLEQSITGPQELRLQREQGRLIAQNILQKNQELSAIYFQFEPNAYDGRDAEFTRGFEHSTDRGTYDVYWVRDDEGALEHYRTADPGVKYLTNINEVNGLREAEWYLCPLETSRPCVIEPYLFEITKDLFQLMTTLAQPIIVGGKAKGMVGVDFNLSKLQKLAEALSKSTYNGQAQVMIVSASGIIAASSHHEEGIAQKISVVEPKAARLWQDNKGDAFVKHAEQQLVMGAPIRVARAGVDWMVLMSVPEQVALSQLDSMNQSIGDMFTQVMTGQVVTGVLLALVGIAILFWLISNITKPIHTISDSIAELASANGDLTKHVVIERHQELIDIGQNLNSFIDKLRAMLTPVSEVSHQLSKISEQNNKTASQALRYTEEQNTQIASIVTALNELAMTSTEVSRLAQKMAVSAESTHKNVDSSKQALDVVVNDVNLLSGDIENARKSIETVSERTENITVILDTIRGIAEQTNLLALNAAIEAARAGEQGRGFAVVADEVRNLASQTQTSTKEIGELIQALHEGVDDSVKVISTGANRVVDTVEHTHKALSLLDKVVLEIDDISVSAEQVATASEEQSTVTEDLNRNMTQIGVEADELAEISSKNIQDAQQLDENARVLEAEISHLKL